MKMLRGKDGAGERRERGWLGNGKRDLIQFLDAFQPSPCSPFSPSTSVAAWVESGKP